MFVLLFVIIVAIAGIGYLIMNANFNIDVDSIVKFMNKFGLILLTLFMVIMYYISYKISCKIYINKEE